MHYQAAGSVLFASANAIGDVASTCPVPISEIWYSSVVRVKKRPRGKTYSEPTVKTPFCAPPSTERYEWPNFHRSSNYNVFTAIPSSERCDIAPYEQTHIIVAIALPPYAPAIIWPCRSIHRTRTFQVKREHLLFSKSAEAPASMAVQNDIVTVILQECTWSAARSTCVSAFQKAQLSAGVSC